MTQPILPQTVNYFHGKITREQAEELLLNRGGTEGLFILRESVNGNFAVSICYNLRVNHYNIEKQNDGCYQIPTGKRFIGPVELVRHHSQHLDGFLTLARFPLERYPPGLTYYVLQGVTAADLEERLRLKAIQMGLKGSNSIEEALSGPMRDHLRSLVLKDLHYSQPWFHDIIHRTDSENRLAEAGHTEGQYLVRTRREDNSFVLSISFQGQPKHYKINCTMEKYQIDNGHYFNSLIEMIDHYHFRSDGLLCKLRYPVESPRYQRARSGTNSTTSRSISGASTPSSLPLATSSTDQSCTPPQNTTGGRHSLGGVSGSHMLPPAAFNSSDNSTTTTTSSSSTTSSPQSTSRLHHHHQPPHRIAPDGSSTGMTPLSLTSPDLINLSTPGLNSFHPHMIHPLQITQNKLEEACVNFSSGFTPTPTPGNPLAALQFRQQQQQQHQFNNKMSGGSMMHPLSVRTTMTQSLESLLHNPSPSPCSGGGGGLGPASTTSNSPIHHQHLQQHNMHLHHRSIPPNTLNHPAIMDQGVWIEPPDNFQFMPSSTFHNNENFGGSGSDLSGGFNSSSGMGSSNNNRHSFLSNTQSFHNFSGSGGNNVVSSSNAGFPIMRDLFSETTQVIYDSLPADDETFNLEPHQITLREKLGGGNFGNVYGGLYRASMDHKEIPVAIKMLKHDEFSHVNQEDILTEARVMSHLKHRHIVRLIGVCRDTQVKMVLELAPLGQINKYLRKNNELSFVNITELMYQVALGMAYLEASKFVHRDLAARNVLLVTEKYAKISDFGMSKALKVGNDYYRAEHAGKWPIKWYAPECIYYFRFDSKSDVWSYGVTMWECYSYGERPYKDMKGTQIVQMIDNGKRLVRPLTCPENIYSLMLQCWEIEGVRRPTFAELVLMLSRILNTFHTNNMGWTGPVLSSGGGSGPHSSSNGTVGDSNSSSTIAGGARVYNSGGSFPRESEVGGSF